MSRSVHRFVECYKKPCCCRKLVHPKGSLEPVLSPQLLCSQLTASPKAAGGCCSVATRRHRCDGKCWVLCTALQGRRGGPCKHMMDVTVVEISWACLSASNLQVERLSRAQPQGRNPEGAIRSSKAFQAGEPGEGR